MLAMNSEQTGGAHIEAMVAVSGTTARPIVAFISYASLDDATPEELPAGSGFVRSLQRQLFFELTTERGLGNVILWRDRTEIEPGDIWNDRIIQALQEADILLVILSRTYRTRPWCNDELETFAGRLDPKLVAEPHGCIIRVDKQRLEDAEVPIRLRPVQAIRFFTFDLLEKIEQPFFWRGRVRDERFYEAIRELGRTIERAIKRLPAPQETDISDKRAASQPGKTAGTTVFVAKPAQDLEQPYRQIVAELHARGFNVAPDPGQALPDEYVEAKSVLDAALNDAALAVHLVGSRPGVIPHGGESGIVPLQLALTEKTRRIERLIWSPRILPKYAVGEQSVVADEREPLEKLTSIGGHLLMGDQLEGGPLAEFRELIVGRLQLKIPAGEELDQIKSKGSLPRVYLLHQEADRAFAVELAKALRVHGAVGVLPTYDDDPRAQEELHERRLAEAEIVALCWGSASRTWVETTTMALNAPVRTGRVQRNQRVVLLAGAMTEQKSEYLELYPPDEIDSVLDGTKTDLETLASTMLTKWQPEGT